MCLYNTRQARWNDDTKHAVDARGYSFPTFSFIPTLDIFIIFSLSLSSFFPFHKPLLVNSFLMFLKVWHQPFTTLHFIYIYILFAINYNRVILVIYGLLHSPSFLSYFFFYKNRTVFLFKILYSENYKFSILFPSFSLSL